MTTIMVERHIDARSMPCPGALTSLIDAIHEQEVGDVIEVRCTDRGARVDALAWLHKAGHELIEDGVEGGTARLVVRKAR